ncbi:peptidoglycan bridge formation glycyltransferase FemA/FemB family protein [Nocardioides marmoriginsengisoli]|uniref:Peptidoglycan bridge formation glycyltransferase FemA/FemB family protein n=1 Tax=Nocardioides marmoriginsengisoli TaxID=661483 RepID=A0A3N0CB96_9ACTN|nr:peptidoglycan bridge formation glycyltransferase FemA/FemB family protein [Nocardioides marmoriginsengisoli]RNL60724.1 peptidoglycan bridge formation glycyltransferase FemA/FemB family protein [Nocardioides marmoriginsengisoli]
MPSAKPPSARAQLQVRTITDAEHLAFLQTRDSASFLQVPAWARVKTEWKAESLGWLRDGELVGVALVLYRQLPKVKRYLAYLPEGPVIDWTDPDIAAWLDPMAAHLKKQGAFGIRIGPQVVTRRWSATQIKDGIADDAVTSLTALPPTERSQVGAAVVSQLREAGWLCQSGESGFSAGQPQYNFQIPLSGPDGPKSEEQVLAQMNQLWRRNIKKAAKAGVEVRVSDGSSEDLAAFHDLYRHTAERDHFTPRGLSYFRTMYDALADEEERSAGKVQIRLYLATHEDDLVAATIWIRVGTHSWYSYGASSTEKRDVRGSNAIQWRMITDSLATGATVYDLRGITQTLASDDPHLGLIQFKVGTGGEAVEYAGEWDLPLNRTVYRAFQLYLKRRG